MREIRKVLDKLLVIGSTGLVGSKVASIADNYNFEVHNTHNRRVSSLPNSERLDVTDRHATLELIRDIKPDAIINAAALTDVDYCETHRDEAELVNVEGVRNLADGARATEARFVQISTDSVFDGTRGHYAENDIPHPINYYSLTKLESEKIVSELKNYAIARPSVVYGWPSHSTGPPSPSTKAMNFALFVINKLRMKERVKAVSDQFSSPTYADNLAEALLRLAKRKVNGIFHTAGKSCLSRYEFAVEISEVFDYATELIQPVVSAEFKQMAARPKNCCLNVEKSELSLAIRFLTASEGITEMKKLVTN